jgi:N-acylneuraminate cytidylyltransferase
MHQTLALIPARGGSKGLPRKNVRRVGGVPLVGRTVQAARQASAVDRVVVSTDDAEIAAAAREHGADVIDRPAALSGDEASSESALLHALGRLDETEGYRPDRVVFLQCTSPFTRPEDIDGTAARLDDGADSAFAASPFHGFVWREGKDGTARGVNHSPDTARQRRQDRPTELLETGAVYAFDADGFREAEHRFFGRVAAYEMPAERSLEVDTPADLERARDRHARLQQADRASALPDPVEAVVFDFDGVFTDNRVLVTEDRTEAVVCNRGDGKGIERLRETGRALLVLSSEVNPVVRARTEKLGLDTLHGIDDKPRVLEEWLDERGISWSQTVFVGNDVNDAGCLRAAGCGAVVADAHPDVRPDADLVLESRGGHGAVRELCDLVCSLSPSASR